MHSTELQNQINACHDAGGGRVTLPPGRHLCGSIELRSNVHLEIPAGSTLAASEDPTLYPVLATTENKPGEIRALLHADDAENVTISGQGTIDGGGSAPQTWAEAGASKFRPAMVFFRNCRSLRFLDLTLRDSTFWTLHLLRCNDVLVRGLTIRNHRPNSDGIDPDGCRNVTISDCNMRTGDDCIVIKSTEGDDCDNITVSNCVLSTPCAALKVGTEGLGNIRNLAFSNCVIHDSQVALAVYMKDGGSYDGVLFSNIIAEAKAPFPIIIDITPRHELTAPGGTVRNIAFQNVLVRSPGRALLQGRPGNPLEGVRIHSLTWEITDGGKPFAEAEKPTGSARITLDPDRNRLAPTPSQLIFSHAQNISLHDLRLVDRRMEPVQDRDLVFTEHCCEAPGSLTSPDR